MAITGQNIVDDLRAEIIEPSPTFFSDARMLSLINLAQNEYVRRTRVLQSFAYTSSIQGQSAYPMPSDWLGSEKVFYNIPNNGIDAWRPLMPTNIEKMGQESPNFLSTAVATQGNPAKYFIIGTTLNIFPKPQISGTNDIFLFYESKPIQLLSLADSLSIDDSLYPGVRAYILEKLWRQDEEDTKADREMVRYEKEIGLGFKWKNKRVLDGRWSIDMPSFVPYSYNAYNSGAVNGQINPLNQ
jgi:hypothetical protein